MQLTCQNCNKVYFGYSYEKQKGRKFCSNLCRREATAAHAKNIFNQWDDESSYILGLIWADGNIYQQKGKNAILDITLKDKGIIEKINNKFEHNCKVYNYTPKVGNTIYSTKTRDKEIIKTLRQEGLCCQKTYDLNWPTTMPMKFNHSFIRGFFDGDGCVFINRVNGYKYLHCSFTSIKTNFFNRLYDILNNLEFNPRWYNDKRTNAYQIRIYSKQQVKNFAEYIYKEEKICLTRKKKIFLENGYLN
jgi:hypothetical protein